MTKQQLIDQIREHNRTAQPEFLVSFNEDALNSYLDHLKYKVAPRHVRSVWVRPGDTAAIVTRVP
jgi:hypothetical protein